LCFRFIDCRRFLPNRKFESDDANRFWISDFQRGFYGNDFGASLLVNASFSAETLINVHDGNFPVSGEKKFNKKLSEKNL